MPKAIRILVYEGPENWLARTLGKSISIHKPVKIGGTLETEAFASIKEVYRDTLSDNEDFPEILIDNVLVSGLMRRK